MISCLVLVIWHCLERLKNYLSSHFEMKDMGGASYVIGIEVHRDRSKGKLYLSQRAYIKKMLERYGMKSSKPSPAPIARGDKLVNANL
jgi:hypothetical protein